ncbi:twin-arginine translocase subunit TatB [Sphingomonas sp. JC676]|uniref:Sec-independent protein translocase protein TatB n=1 Tax=Sphingomonas sp. JC676 TaxID=2768065 RepID=UPI001657A738|nr:Sec-independent protein translocase protein TatB [Sphingomonas sp. JC676]MBC9032343.1 twin-arginine translocase subunit TatB [Sphingomonas sp. JC676]
MFDVAPTELLLVAVVALLVIGPKDLPRAMRIVGKWVGRARGIARQFRSGIDTMIRESELAEMEKQWAAENERIMREYPPQPSLPAPETEPAVENQLIEHHDTAPVMVEQPAIVEAAPPKPRPKRTAKPKAAVDPEPAEAAPAPKRTRKPKAAAAQVQDEPQP